MKQAACPHLIFSGRTPPELKSSLAILVQDQWIYVSIAAGSRIGYDHEIQFFFVVLDKMLLT